MYVTLLHTAACYAVNYRYSVYSVNDALVPPLCRLGRDCHSHVTVTILLLFFFLEYFYSMCWF